MITMNSTSESANANFITDHGSTRLTVSRARRGPRDAAIDDVVRAVRAASATRAAPSAPAAPVAGRPGRVPTATRPVTGPPGRVMPGAGGALIGGATATPVVTTGTDAEAPIIDAPTEAVARVGS